MTQARITPEAASDLADIAFYIARDNPDRARTFIGDIVAHCHRIAKQSGIGRARPEFGAGIRSVPHGHYVIFYHHIETGTEILHVTDGARDVGRLFPRSG